MKAYFIRRLLLVPITMIGVTLLVFLLTRAVPGGPMERALQQAQQAAQEGGGSGQEGGGLTEEQIEELEEEYGWDQTAVVAYLQWLGVWQRDRLVSKKDFNQQAEETVGSTVVDDPEFQTLVVLKGDGREALVEGTKKLQEVTRQEWVVEEGKDTDGPPKTVRAEKTREVEVWKVESAKFVKDGVVGGDIGSEGWVVRIESPDDRQMRWAERNKKPLEGARDNYDARVVASKKRFAGLLQGDLGRSTSFGDPVIDLILARIPVALYFGILTVIITYGVCLPLGILKAIKHRTPIDTATSILIFIGYSIPGFALGGVMLVYLGARLEWFPMFDWRSANFHDLSPWEQVKDLAHHTVLPLSCYVVSGFAMMTMMMKNNLMDNLAADYVRTAVAKGCSFNRAVFKHAFRNSIIPIASTIGQLVTILVAGSILIETVFDIQGFGLLQYQALIGRDQTVIMGTLTISAFLLIIGNILSDVIVATIDPRVKFR